MHFDSAAIEWLIPLAVVALVVVFILRRRGKPDVPAAGAAPTALPAVIQPKPAAVRSPEPKPASIIIGKRPDEPMMTIRRINTPKEFGAVKPLGEPARNAISRLSPLLQAVPSVLVAQQAAGKHLMEVVVNGNLVQAADGNGFRAFVMGSTGIKEQARLFDVKNLENLVNAAAIWQVASVLVAQKHLADISRKLDEIKKEVAGISRFLDNQRKARVSSTYEYLGQIFLALQGGELSPATRNQLESCERDLTEILDHLVMEYQQKAAARVEVSELGTGELYAGIGNKMDNLDLLAQDVAVCLKTRIAAWHVLALFPGDPHLKAARKASIYKSIHKFAELGPRGRKSLESEIASIKAVFNWESTLAARRKSLTDKNTAAVQHLSELSRQGLDQVRSSEQAMLESDSPMHLLLHIENGVLVGAGQRVYPPRMCTTHRRSRP